MVRAMDDLHSFAAWRHERAREGFEVVFVDGADTGPRFDGTTTAIEDGKPWAVEHAIVRARSRAGTRELTLTSTGDGFWQVNGEPAPHLHGCRDVDLEASVVTNAFPVRRLGLTPGQGADAPTAYVRRGCDGPEERNDYAAPAFNFSCELTYAADGLVRDYPGIAVRVGRQAPRGLPDKWCAWSHLHASRPRASRGTGGG